MFEWITSTMNSMGYWGIVLLMFLENIFPPVPSELIMPLAGYLSERGDLSFGWVVAAGTAGSALGALPWFFLARKMGEERLRDWADQHGKWLTLSGKDIDRARHWFDRHGSAAVFFCRLIPGVRTLISLPAGFSKMNLFVFLLYSMLGTGLWAGLLAYLGRILGQNYQLVDQYLGPATTIILGGIAAYFIYEIWKRKKEGQGQRERSRAPG
jgi:membrane protein DedA with SNARE-associated domain